MVGAAFSSPALLKGYWSSGGRKTQESKDILTPSHLSNIHGLTRFPCTAKARLLMTKDGTQKHSEVGQRRKHYAESIIVRTDKEPGDCDPSRGHIGGSQMNKFERNVRTTHMSLPNRPALTSSSSIQNGGAGSMVVGSHSGKQV